MIEHAIDPYWFEWPRLLWTTTACGYWYAAVHLRALSTRSYPTWCWGTFFVIGTAVFLVINGDYWLGGTSYYLTVIEYFAIAAVAGGGIALFLLARRYADALEELEKLRTDD